ncbi:MAG: hypothetical protein FWE91_01745 [Defluviitaleaceae bacterium]|nr:hypothetical protein [Defluviitaleaceae bacterium]MCL2835874.1 hypothetical protein [Defluviitaleaceae bacterium]
MITGTALNDILGSAMQAAAFRDRVYAHNIANNDTPKFKKYEVSFEESLRTAVDGYKRTGVLDLSRATPVAHRVHTNLSTRIDGNNVDINEESALVYRNSIIYDMLANSYMANKQLHSIVYNGIN